jgi:predicted DNA binding CopG/RHH family protein
MQEKVVVSRKAIRKDHQSGVRFTENEYDIIKQKARESGLTVSSYIREIVLKFLQEN